MKPHAPFRAAAVLAAAFFITTASGGCRGSETETARPEPAVRPVRAVQVQPRSGAEARVFPGKTAASTEVDLAFRVANQIIELPVKVGQFVEKGDLIARLDPTDFQTRTRGYQAQLEGARASLNEARLSYDRYKALYAEGNAPKASYDQAEAMLETARAKVESIEQQLRQARMNLGYTRLTAPFDGYIAARYVDNFQNVAAGHPVVKLQKIDDLEVTIGLPDDMITLRDRITRVSVSLEAYPGRVFPAGIKEIATDSNSRTGTFPVTVSLERSGEVELLPGMAADVKVEFDTNGEGGGFLVPDTAVFSDDGSSWIWVFDPQTSTVSRRQVEMAAVTDHGTVLTSGLKEGDVVITAGVHYLSEGRRVRLLKK